MKILGNVIIYFALFLIFQFSGLGGRSGFTFVGFLGSLVVAVPMLLVGGWLVSKHEEAKQSVIDADARTILARPSELSDKTYFLYLRPFASTNAYRLSDTHLNLFSWELWERDGFDDIERILARALRPTADFVALGEPGEHRGAARILTTEASWKTELSQLAENAELVLLLPSYRAGTLWELSLLKRINAFDKTICIMPPSNSPFYVAEEPNTPEEWMKTRTACSEIGIRLPDHISSGALFTLDIEKGETHLQAMPPPDPRAWTAAIQKLLDDR